MKKIINKLTFIILCSFITLFIVSFSVKAKERIIITDFAYDTSTNNAITGDYTVSTETSYFSESVNVNVNGNNYASVKCLRLNHNYTLSYDIQDNNVTSITATIYGQTNSTTKTATFTLNTYDDINGQNLIENKTGTINGQNLNGCTYNTVTQKALSATPAVISINDVRNIKKIIIQVASDVGTVLSRIKLQYNYTPTFVEMFEDEQTRSSLKLNYTNENSDVIFNTSNTAIRFGTTIPKSLYNGLITEGATEFGVITSKENTLANNDLIYSNAKVKKAITPVRVSSPLAQYEDVNGDYYQFALVINDIPVSDYDVNFVARCYVKVGDTYHYMEEANYSIAKLSRVYKENYDLNVSGFEICQDHVQALEYLTTLIAAPNVYVYYIDLEGAPGDAALIKIEDIDILVDGGDNVTKSIENLNGFLDSKVTDDIIEYMVITHPDSDHYGGLSSVFENFQVKEVFKYSTNLTTKTQALQNFETKMNSESGCIINEIFTWLDGSNSKSLTVSDQVYLQFFDTNYLNLEKSNESSIVFCLEAYSTKVLFTGDAEKNQENVYAPLCGNVDIYSFGHHGSSISAESVLLNSCDPEVCIAQVGDKLGNQYGHPTIEAMTRVYSYDNDIKIYCTAGEADELGGYTSHRNGTITVTIDTATYRIASEFNDGVLYEMRSTAYWNTPQQ